ncbi:MAG: hypothetical protein ACLUGP_08985 [Faecalibacterium prausnitzii]
MSSFSGIKNTLLAEQVEEQLPPPMTQTQKQQGPGAICSGACCHFLWKKSCFSGVLRVLSICGDYDEAHRCLLSVNGQSTKCSAYVADVSGFFACQLICIRELFGSGYYSSHYEPVRLFRSHRQ